MTERYLAPAFRPLLALGIVAAFCAQTVSSQPSIDGGRSDLPGMKQDMFDEVHRRKKNGQKQRMGKEPPACPKADGMTPFTSIAFVEGKLFVRLESSDGPCHELLSVGGANFSVLKNASLTCGPVGEWKKRVAEDMSAVFFQGGLDWVRSDNETIEVITEEGTFQVPVSEAKYALMMDCWKKSCGCEQANNPRMKILLITLLAIALAGLSYDSVKLAWDQFSGKKPSKHVLCKKGYRVVEVNFSYSHLCDICRKSGTCYQSSLASCNYDMCKICYKAAKKKQKALFKDWLEKHPEDEDNKKKDKDDDDDDAKKDDSQSEAGDKRDAKADKSEAESDAPGDGSEAKSEEKTEDESEAKSEKKDADE